MTLPPLPEPLVMVNRYGQGASTSDGDGGVFTADQMHEYATAAVLAEREALDSSWEALRVWKEEGERIMERHAHNFMFYIGAWWADRPWRDRPTD